MAIYHFSVKPISRGRGQSAIASASYRSGEKLKDERTGETKYFKRDVQPENMILAPSHSPEWVYNRQRLWNEVEKSETKCNSRLAREVRVALPRELSHDQQRELLKGYIQNEFVNKGMVADIAIHRDNVSNPHAHVMLTTREISEEGFTNKNRDWNQREMLKDWRKEWANYANRSLEKAGSKERITHLSNKDRDLEHLPTKHEGFAVRAMEKRGIKTEIGDHNRAVKEYNQTVVDLQKYREEKKDLQQQIKQKKFLKPDELAHIKETTKIINGKGKGFVSLQNIDKRRGQLANWNKRLDNQQNSLNRQNDQFHKAQSYVDKLHNIQQEKARFQNEIKNIKDIKGVWEQNKWEGTKKAFERTFNRKEGNQQIEQAERQIQRLEKHEQDFNKYLEPYRDKFNFQSREEFYNQQTKFEIEREKGMDDIRKQRAEIKSQQQNLKQAEQILQRKEVREVSSQHPELKHLSETMKYKDALNLKEINTLSGEVVPISRLRSELEQRTDTIKQASQDLKAIENAEKTVTQAESNFKKLDDVQEKIEKFENKNTVGKMFTGKQAKQEHERHLLQRDHLQKANEKLGFSTKNDLEEFKGKLEKVQERKPAIEQSLQQAKEGENGIDINKLESTMKAVERAEKDFQKEQKQRDREHEKGKEPEIEMDM